MRRGLIALAVVAALAFPATAAANTVASKKNVTIKLLSLSTVLKEFDNPPKGPNNGDRVVYRDNLLNSVRQFGRAKGAKVGSDRGVMTFTGAKTARYAGSTRLPGGTLTLRGKVTPIPYGFTVPVVGGTGRYAGAKGTLIVGPGKNALNVYVLRVPASIA